MAGAAPTFVSLYSGAGGLDIGLTLAGFAPIFSNDIDPDATSTYKAAMTAASNTAPHLAETTHRVTTGDIRGIKDLPGRGSADLVVGGPPCQGFSVAGKMDPNDPRSRHVFDFLGVVDRVQPRAFIMENVKALAVNDRWSGTRADLLKAAGEMGYRTSLHVLNASHYGVPQARERMFLIGVRDAGPLPEPRATSNEQPRTVRDALGEMPAWGEEGNDDFCTARVTPARNPVLRRSAWAGMLFNGQGRPMNLDAPAPTLPASMGGNRTPIIDQLSLSESVPSWVLDYHKHLWAGGTPVREIPTRLRRITVQEAASLQTFPIDMPWSGPQSARYRQIGNAVPPMLAYAVATALRDHLDYPQPQRPPMFLALPAKEGSALPVLAGV